MPNVVLQVPELEANSFFLSDSPFTRYIFKWLAYFPNFKTTNLRWFLCAMTPECIAPLGAQVKCDIPKYPDTFRVYINCHRFDQVIVLKVLKNTYFKAFFNIVSLAYMFGEQRAALDYKYLKQNWTHIDAKLMDDFHKARFGVVSHYANSLIVQRWDEK